LLENSDFLEWRTLKLNLTKVFTEKIKHTICIRRN
jgi:hypothetical protein